MIRVAVLLCAAAVWASAAEEPIVFRSDVALVRVDAQVVDRQNRAITGLTEQAFVLYENGKPQAIKNFASEEMPVDIVMLLDVSGSMQSHVARVASAAREAIHVLGNDDRVAIMVFDRATRIRMPFRRNGDEIWRGLDDVLRQETFDGGTDIARGLNDAISYISREGRRDARRAIVILTDDQTERGSDESGISRSLADANTVLSALLAPDAMRSGRIGTGGGTWPGGGGSTWPSGPLGGIILGRRPPYGGSRGPVIMSGPRTQSAGTAEIARRSGGDSMRVDEAAALETTLARLRQRYAMYFSLAEAQKSGQGRDIEVELSAAARRRYPDAEVRYRRVHIGDEGQGSNSDEPVMISKTSRRAPETVASGEPDAPPLKHRRRPAVSGDSRTDGPIEPRTGGWRRADATDAPVEDEPKAAPAPKSAPARVEAAPAEQPKQGGWRRVKPGEQP
jgi:VWFA-related protein